VKQIFRIIADPRPGVNAENNHKFFAEGKIGAATHKARR
jgi:hypothetical protein